MNKLIFITIILTNYLFIYRLHAISYVLLKTLGLHLELKLEHILLKVHLHSVFLLHNIWK